MQSFPRQDKKTQHCRGGMAFYKDSLCALLLLLKHSEVLLKVSGHSWKVSRAVEPNMHMHMQNLYTMEALYIILEPHIHLHDLRKIHRKIHWKINRKIKWKIIGKSIHKSIAKSIGFQLIRINWENINWKKYRLIDPNQSPMLRVVSGAATVDLLPLWALVAVRRSIHWTSFSR